jgi:sugar O-acyltransferase (sialic acid O-acetyltransferase NeuD family)
MDRYVMWGATGQAKMLYDFLETPARRLVALFDNNPARVSPFPGVPLYHGPEGFRSWLAADGGEDVGFMVAVGFPGGRDRLELQDYLTEHGLTPLTAIHPTAFVAASATVGAGSQVLALTAIDAWASIGRVCIISKCASVGHDCVLEDGAQIASGVRLGGEVRLGTCASVGLGAIILPRLTVGAGAIVGAGSVVLQDVPPGVVVAGNPARVLRAR